MAGRELAVVGGDERELPVARPQGVGGLLKPIAAPAEVMAAQNEARDLVQQALKPGRDYGVIPGTDKDRPTLLKPGAERILAAFGCYGDPEVIEQEVDHDREVRWIKRKKQWANRHPGDKKFTWVTEEGTSIGLYRYVVRCHVIRRDTGEIVGSGIGSCSSMESKYVDRPRESENTILKMAKKRAEVDAVLSTFGLSDQFAPDPEEAAADEETDEQLPPPPAAAPAGPMATDEQLELIAKLKNSHVFTDRERSQLERRMGNGMTKAQAQEAIDWMLGALKERKAAESQDGAARPAVAERMPGEDDDEAQDS